MEEVDEKEKRRLAKNAKARERYELKRLAERRPHGRIMGDLQKRFPPRVSSFPSSRPKTPRSNTPTTRRGNI